MNISKQRAESLKKQKKDFLSDQKSMLMFPSLGLIVKEVQRIIKSYRSKSENARLDNIILSGGTSKLAGMDAYFSKALNIKAIIGNPWSRIDFDENLSSRIKEMGPSFSVAVGLALKGVEEYKRK